MFRGSKAMLNVQSSLTSDCKVHRWSLKVIRPMIMMMMMSGDDDHHPPGFPGSSSLIPGDGELAC